MKLQRSFGHRRLESGFSLGEDQTLEIMEDSSTDSSLIGDKRTNFREGAYPIPLEILKQKLLLQRGLVLMS